MGNEPCAAGPCLTDTQATLEAARCLMCADPPCVAACPAEVPVKHFIRALRFDSPRRAINLIRARNVFAGVCGLACPVDRLCVGACASTELSTPIAVGKLQHYAAQSELRCGRSVPAGSACGRKVAVVGAGPAGLAAAAELARLGHIPTVFEKNPRPGGICTYGVPAQRIPQELVAGEIEYITSLGVEIRTSSRFGQDNTLDGLLAAGYRAVYVAVGLQQAVVPSIPGVKLRGVLTWKQLLEGFSAFNLGEGDKPAVAHSVIVVGGGGVAMDVASVARQLGAEEVDVVCLESPREMPAERGELGEVWEGGARFHTRSMPLEITADNGKVSGLRAARIRWKHNGVIPSAARKLPTPAQFTPSSAEIIPGTEYWLPGAMVVFAIGARPAADLAQSLPRVALDASGRIIVDPDTGATSRDGVFAGGDAVAGGGTTIVQAVAEGKRAAQAIDAFLRRTA